MGTYQLSEMREEIKLHFADRSDLTDAQINRAVNLAQERMARPIDFQELKVLVTGNTLPYTGVKADDKLFAYTQLPSGSQDPKSIYTFRIITSDGRSRKLVPWNQMTFDERVPEPQFFAADVPRHYIRWGNGFELYPVQNQAYNYEIRMSKWPTAMTSDSQKSDFDRKDDVLINLVISQIWGRFGEYERANRFFGIFNRLWNEAVEEELGKPDRNIVSPETRKILDLPGDYWARPFVRSVR